MLSIRLFALLGNPGPRDRLRRRILVSLAFTIAAAITHAIGRRIVVIHRHSVSAPHPSETEPSHRGRHGRAGHDGDLDEYRFDCPHIDLECERVGFGNRRPVQAVLIHVPDRRNV